jgi:hypothetical protein
VIVKNQTDDSAQTRLESSYSIFILKINETILKPLQSLLACSTFVYAFKDLGSITSPLNTALNFSAIDRILTLVSLKRLLKRYAQGKKIIVQKNTRKKLKWPLVLKS